MWIVIEVELVPVSEIVIVIPVVYFIIIIIIINWSPLCKERRERENTLSVKKTPTPHNQPMEGRKR